MAESSRESTREQADFQEPHDGHGEELFPEAEPVTTNTNGPKQNSLLEEEEDLFTEATEEVSLDSPERDVLLSDGPSPVTPPASLISPHLPHNHLYTHCSFDEKVGDGMNAYMAYKTSMSLFKTKQFSVKRRFSDFLGLHGKLASKYLHVGYLVPPAPEKSIVGMTKVKVGKDDQSSNEFVEKRRAALERYLMRTVKHPVLLKDPDLLQFLECSEWFEEKQQQFENLDIQLRKLHSSLESLVCHRKELSVNTALFAKSAAMLGNSEDHTALSRALSQLAEVEEKMEQLHQDQASADFYLLSELLADYIRLITSVKGVFDHRVKVWQKLQDIQLLLQKKREAEAKLHANKPDKLQQARDDIKELEVKVQQGERDFEQISKTIRKELGRFEKDRVSDFKVVIIKYLESLVQTQQQHIKYWEAFLPEAKAIS
ncbi:hypothetical protein NHX12_029269 [Muraenolepis orangiensis]|uniref:Sorting nexin-2 n=1 Tax=Muraenolepis orangiensis TaxID=630683 RepID=A0A9Q0EDE2_9TELE|nr:hypothetical protein NHX12_029269 [Muraenolepis orangiensis]